MTEKGSISQAENRVKEMNRMTRQLLEQSNKALRQNAAQNMQKAPPPQSRPGMPYSSTGTRFEQMNRPSRNGGSVQRAGPPPPPTSPPPMSSPMSMSSSMTSQKPCENSPAPKPESGLADLFSDNGEMLLILLIIVLLMKEKADMKLIIALGYLLI